MKKTIFIFGGLCALMLLLFQLERWSLFAIGGHESILPVLSGVLFLLLGFLLSRYYTGHSKARKRLEQQSSLSPQELRVLNLVAEGLTNKEIADRLFIAETTVKSHVSNILVKLDAKRRTEAVKIGRELQII